MRILSKRDSTLYFYGKFVAKFVRKHVEASVEIDKVKIIASAGHFVPVYCFYSRGYLMENYGEPLDKSNAPKDWEEQINRIVESLNDNNVVHGDLNPTNIMVKNGIIKVIDPWHKGFDIDQIVQDSQAVERVRECLS